MEKKYIVLLEGNLGLIDAEFIRWLYYIHNVQYPDHLITLILKDSSIPEIISKKDILLLLREISIIDEVKNHSEYSNQFIFECIQPNLKIPEKQLQEYTFKTFQKTHPTLLFNCLNIPTKSIYLQEAKKINEMNNNTIIGLISGSFDVIHNGHIIYIQEAKKLVDILFVAVQSTVSIQKQSKNFNQSRPIYSQEDRELFLSSLKSIDYIIFFDDINCISLLDEFYPDYFIKNKEDFLRPVVQQECKTVEKHGGKVILMDLIRETSTSAIIQKFLHWR